MSGSPDDNLLRTHYQIASRDRNLSLYNNIRVMISHSIRAPQRRLVPVDNYTGSLGATRNDSDFGHQVDAVSSWLIVQLQEDWHVGWATDSATQEGGADTPR